MSEKVSPLAPPLALPLAVGTVLAGHGIGLNSAIGEVFVVRQPAPLPKWVKSELNTDEESAALQNSVANVAKYLEGLGAAAKSDAVAEIFEALCFMLQDEELFGLAKSHLADGWTAAAAFGKAIDTFAELIGGEDIFDARVADLKDLSKRVQADLASIDLSITLPTVGRVVLVGQDFSPVDTTQFSKAVVGVVTLGGGPTSHTAILCRSLGIAAVVGCDAASALANGDTVLVDPVGDRVVFGGDETLATMALQLVKINIEPLIPVRANVGSLTDAQNATANTQAIGVGLLRTELLYLSSRVAPTIYEQAAAYADIFEAAPMGPIVVRTIDAGSDKPVPFLHMPFEENPALGVRGFRLAQIHPKFIEDQLISLEMARAKTGRDIWVMAPMIATVQEAKKFSDLARSLGSYKVGITVETPAISTIIDQLAGIVDFVSVGTNDLSQYLFAADRMNPNMSALTNHWQPALIRTIARIIDGAAKGGFSVAVCGESASEPAFAVVLAGLGIDSVSVSVSQIEAVREALSALDLAKAKEIANLVLMATSPEQAKATAINELSQL